MSTVDRARCAPQRTSANPRPKPGEHMHGTAEARRLASLVRWHVQHDSPIDATLASIGEVAA